MVRSNSIFKKAVNWQASKPLINGIDINSLELDNKQINTVQSEIKKMYSPLKEVSSFGVSYGGAGGLLWFSDVKISDLDKPPLIVSKNKKKYLYGY